MQNIYSALWSNFFRALATNILPEVAAEQEDVNERIKAKDNGWAHLEYISVLLRLLDA